MSLTIYLDESGNTGDVFVNKMEDFFFNNQPYFVLAAIGIPTGFERDLKEFIDKLRKKYRIQSNELKVKNKSFSIELMRCIYDLDIPIFIEVTHKKYFLSCQICNLIIDPLIDEYAVTDAFLEMQRQSADLIMESFPDYIFFDFCNVCRKRDVTSFESFLYSLHQYLLNEPDMLNFTELVEESMQSYLALKRKDNLPKAAHEFFLPLPDRNKKGEIISSLPHIPSLANICMRAEKYREINNISNIKYIHDEQARLWDILFDNVSFLMQELNTDFVRYNHLKHNISPNLPADTSITVGISHENIGLAIVDVFARSFYRFWVDYEKTNTIDKDYCALFQSLQQFVPGKYFGVNLVLPQKQVDQYHRSTGQQ